MVDMKALRIADSANVSLGLQEEIRRSEESRYDHRLHGVLLVAQGMTCPEVASLLGDVPRSVENWVRRFELEGLAGLLEGERPGLTAALALSTQGGSRAPQAGSHGSVRGAHRKMCPYRESRCACSPIASRRKK